MSRAVVFTALLLFPGVLAAAESKPAESKPADSQSVDSKAPIKVFILAGQSNMEGKAKLALLNYQAEQPATAAFFAHLRKDGKWIERNDVWIKFLGRKGKLTVGYGSPNCIGPELEFGTVMGDHYKQQVLLIKTAWGGRSLYRDFRPPSAGMPSAAVLEKSLENMKKKHPDATLADVKKPYGAAYRDMIAEIHDTLAHLKQLFPDYAGQGYEIDGIVWFQGWNDMINADYTHDYTANLADFIRDVRKDLKAPKLPFVVLQMGVDGPNANGHVEKFKAAEAAVMKLPEFQGNVAVVKTDRFWDTAAAAVFKKGWRKHKDEWNKVGSDYGFHYLGSAKTMCEIGQAAAEAMLKLCREKK